MPKSRIIQALVDGELGLDQALLRLQVLANDLKNTELGNWAESELVGYGTEDVLPDYRNAKSIDLVYSGINNYQFKVENVSLPIGFN